MVLVCFLIRVKQPPTAGSKSNPSKRHRDRLNGELERLASLLPFPEEVTASLDKLSILRLSVSYLRAKSFFSEPAERAPSMRECLIFRVSACLSGLIYQLLGQIHLASALNGFILVITASGTIFYSSHTIQDYLGFHQVSVCFSLYLHPLIVIPHY
uniref:BHLH domain-containing protein n=1 Tax=Haplochromis burtoni TaxID=8153 RepID=A0A3Q2X1S3_HAPBU